MAHWRRGRSTGRRWGRSVSGPGAGPGAGLRRRRRRRGLPEPDNRRRKVWGVWAARTAGIARQNNKVIVLFIFNLPTGRVCCREWFVLFVCDLGDDADMSAVFQRDSCDRHLLAPASGWCGPSRRGRGLRERGLRRPIPSCRLFHRRPSYIARCADWLPFPLFDDAGQRNDLLDFIGRIAVVRKGRKRAKQHGHGSRQCNDASTT